MNEQLQDTPQERQRLKLAMWRAQKVVYDTLPVSEQQDIDARAASMGRERAIEERFVEDDYLTGEFEARVASHRDRAWSYEMTRRHAFRVNAAMEARRQGDDSAPRSSAAWAKHASSLPSPSDKLSITAPRVFAQPVTFPEPAPEPLVDPCGW